MRSAKRITFIFNLLLNSLLPISLCAQTPSSPAGFRWSSDDIIFHVHGQDSTAMMGLQIAGLGDVNGDGYDDIAVAYNPLSTSFIGYALNIYFGGNPPDSIPDMTFGRGLSMYPQMIDATGDGMPDLVAAAFGNVGAGFKNGIFLFMGFADSIASTPFDSICPQINNDGFGAQFQMAFVDSDAWPDLLASKTAVPFPESSMVYYFSSPLVLDTVADWTFKINQSQFNLGPIGYIDFNGDSTEDIFVTLLEGYDTLPKVLIFLGPAFPPTPDVIISAPNVSNSLGPRYFALNVSTVGDIDGDSFDDLAIDYTHEYYIYRCGPVADTIPDFRLSGLHWSAAAAGDVNGDGQQDLVTGDASFFGGISAFLGGIEWDPFSDASIGRLDLPTLYLDEIGYHVAPAGDVNGDGFDDVIFSCRNFANGEPGDVFVIKGGPRIITGVDESSVSRLPQDKARLRAYPNPFNSEATIEFKLQTRTNATIVIYNSLGQKVATVVQDVVLAAGIHRAQWKGVDDNKGAVANGLYYCRLSTSEGDLVTKLIYLK